MIGQCLALAFRSFIHISGDIKGNQYDPGPGNHADSVTIKNTIQKIDYSQHDKQNN